MEPTLKKILATVSASNEDDINELMELMNPTDRESMGKRYEESIGYNPITYFDKMEMEEIFEEICVEDIPISKSNEIRKIKDQIIDSAMSKRIASNRAVLSYIIASEIASMIEYPQLEKEFWERLREEFPHSLEDIIDIQDEDLISDEDELDDEDEFMEDE